MVEIEYLYVKSSKSKINSMLKIKLMKIKQNSTILFGLTPNYTKYTYNKYTLDSLFR